MTNGPAHDGLALGRGQRKGSRAGARERSGADLGSNETGDQEHAHRQQQRRQKTTKHLGWPWPGRKPADALPERARGGDRLVDDLRSVVLARVDPAIELLSQLAYSIFNPGEQNLLLIDQAAVDAPERQDEACRAERD